MTVFVEKKSDSTVLMGFLALVFGAAGIRGAVNGSVLGWVFIGLAVVVVVLAVVWRRGPGSRLEVDEQRIVWSRQGAESVVFEKAQSPSVQFRKASAKAASQWTLTRPDQPAGAPRMDLFGYNAFEVRDTLATLGWDVTM